MSFILCAFRQIFALLNVNQFVMTKEKIKVPEKEKKTHNFTIRFSESERSNLYNFCSRKKTTLTELIRFSLKTIIEKSN